MVVTLAPLRLLVPLSVTPPELLRMPLLQVNGPLTATGPVPPKVPPFKVRLDTAMLPGVFTFNVPLLMRLVPASEIVPPQLTLPPDTSSVPAPVRLAGELNA